MKNNICIIIVTYNSSIYIDNLFNSLLKQNNPKFEIVVIDNNSNDDTINKLSKYMKKEKRIHLIKNNSNLGFSKANNIGINYSIDNFNPDYFLLLNHDTVVENNLLATLIFWENYFDNSAALSPMILIKNNNWMSF